MNTSQYNVGYLIYSFKSLRSIKLCNGLTKQINVYFFADMSSLSQKGDFWNDVHLSYILCVVLYSSNM